MRLPQTLEVLHVERLFNHKDARVAEMIHENVSKMPKFRRLEVMGPVGALERTVSACESHKIILVCE